MLESIPLTPMYQDLFAFDDKYYTHNHVPLFFEIFHSLPPILPNNDMITLSLYFFLSKEKKQILQMARELGSLNVF